MGSCKKWTKCDKFYDGYKSFRDAPIEHGLSFTEYRKRGQLVSKLEKQGISRDKIENYWGLYKLRDGDVNNTNSFETFINNQRLIQQAKLIAEKELLEKLKAEEKLKEISDLNLFPPKKEDTGSPTNTSTPTIDKKEPNYLLYGGIGLAILIGAILIFKKKIK
tara:strand:- start:6645 stop:7133 length:489 start_codon:yes stop_codon:yes gene_type:complete